MRYYVKSWKPRKQSRLQLSNIWDCYGWYCCYGCCGLLWFFHVLPFWHPKTVVMVLNMLLPALPRLPLAVQSGSLGGDALKRFEKSQAGPPRKLRDCIGLLGSRGVNMSQVAELARSCKVRFAMSHQSSSCPLLAGAETSGKPVQTLIEAITSGSDRGLNEPFRCRSFCSSSFSMTSAAVIALGKSCLLARTSSTAFSISCSCSILSNSSLASWIRSRSELSTT